MIFITPIPPTSNEMLAIQISMLLVEELKSCMDFACSRRLSLLYFILDSLFTVRFALRISAVFLPAAVILSVSEAFATQL